MENLSNRPIQHEQKCRDGKLEQDRKHYDLNMIINSGNKTFDIEINEKHGKFNAVVDGVSVEIIPEFDSIGHISAINLDGKQYGIRLRKSKDNYKVSVFSNPLNVSIIHSKTESDHAVTDQKIITIHSPMSGLVINMLLKIGQEISKDEHLLTLEAMKMQNEIKSPINAKVLEVSVKVGQTVEKDEKLIVLEPI